ncbi:MAG: hypothetical protein IJ087_16425, partial [Eggerthellaceae bacterium]|nr:hypothetical protein [Eggerthellaceae bacterium]
MYSNEQKSDGYTRRQLLTTAGGALGVLFSATAVRATASAETYTSAKQDASDVSTISLTQSLQSSSGNKSVTDDIQKRISELQAALDAYDECYHVWLATEGIARFTFPSGASAEKG